jgi:hypothetical protein
MKIFYRISDAGYKKNKPDYINNESCLKNFTKVFAEHSNNIFVTADNVSEDTYNMICKYIKEDNITRVSIGHGAGTFNLTLDQALQENDDEVIYFVENDYLHRMGSPDILFEGLSLGFPYLTLYDHPDKYIDPAMGGNPFCQGNAENTRVYRTYSCHWKITNSTTMTFASRVKDLKIDETIMRKWTSDIHPNDFQMFLEIRNNSRFLLSPLPSYSTHGEVEWLAPIINWKQIADE